MCTINTEFEELYETNESGQNNSKQSTINLKTFSSFMQIKGLPCT